MAPGGLLGAPGASWGPLEPPGGLLRPSEASWALLGASGSSLGPLWASRISKSFKNYRKKCQKLKVFGIKMDNGGGRYDERI